MVWKAKSRNGNEYIDVKLKIDEFKTIRIMKSQNPLITEHYLKSLKMGSVPIALKSVYIANNACLFQYFSWK